MATLFTIQNTKLKLLEGWEAGRLGGREAIRLECWEAGKPGCLEAKFGKLIKSISFPASWLPRFPAFKLPGFPASWLPRH